MDALVDAELEGLIGDNDHVVVDWDEATSAFTARKDVESR
jgi:hypothetical protein